MKILMISSEAVPFVQTGGLGDVVGTLSLELSKKNHTVYLVIPLYRDLKQKLSDYKIALSVLEVKMGNSTMKCRIWKSKTSSNLKIFFIEYDQYFDRPALYDDGKDAYHDNGSRFGFLSKAALELAIQLKFKPDIAHIHDWQTSLIPYFLKTWYWNEKSFKNCGSVLTIHNMGYQGQFNLSISKFIGLNWMQIRADEFEAFGALNLLKGGIFYADQVTTVSPNYANEILSEPGGCGLSEYLVRRKDDVVGITNGIDEAEWNPQTDTLIPATFGIKNMKGKQICKKELQRRFYLVDDPNIPVFGIVSRMAHQKGFNLLLKCITEILSWNLQLVVLGSGDPQYSDYFSTLPKQYPGKVGTYIGFHHELAHLIEAGSDFFIMPSLYEPCGLNQLYSMLYGTIPIVRSTGGLKDTVYNFDEKTNKGTGFVFDDPTSEALRNTIGWALCVWYNNRKAYKTMQKRAMAQTFSWTTAVEEYEKVYKMAIIRKKVWH